MTSITTSDIEDLNYLASLYIGLYFFSNNATPTPTDTLTTGSDGAKNLLYELTTITKTVSTSTASLLISFAIPISNFFPKSTIASSSTSTALNLVSASGFSIRDRVLVEVSGGFQRAVITGISGNTLTVTGLTVAPSIGTNVKVLCCQVAIKKSTASGISDIFIDDFYKTAGIPLTGNITIPIKRG